MRATLITAAAIALLALVAAVTGACGGGADRPGGEEASALPAGSEPVELDPSAFTTQIDNPYWPMTPGARWVYRETGSGGSVERVDVRVTHRTKRIANGVEARVVRDVVSEHGELVEVTDDWYAQDAEGNIWYLGERTAEYRDGEVVSRAGSFEAGVDGAQAGIAMPADPKPGLAYRQEHYAGEAEDRAVVLSLDEQVEVPAGHFTGALMTRDENPLEPRVSEHKLYVKGVGPVLALKISGEVGREELIRYSPGA